MKGRSKDPSDSTTDSTTDSKTAPAPRPGKRGGEPEGAERRRWQELEELLQEALDLRGEQREAFLQGACRGRQDLRRELDSLLELEEPAAEFAEAPYFPREPPAGAGPSEGMRIGAYRLAGRIARGGMGEVWRGRRVDREFDQQVAIKVLRQGEGSREILSRFRHERQILADLNHPHIAKLLDGGTTAEGPYLIMEFVEGMPLDRYCARAALSPEQRLDLFLTICEAVDYAHRNLVVHRDLKPANILVTPEGSPVLLDFGIAKILSPGGEAAVRGGRSRRFASPGYAAPEQLAGEAVSVATDVFSLGVLLHVVAFGGPPPPSYYPSPQGWPWTPGTKAKARPGPPYRVSRRLAEDLRAVVRMAMADRPEDRYPSVRELAEEVRRCLALRPLRARRGSFWYRSGRYLQRNRLRWGAGLACGSLLALVAFQAVRDHLEAAELNHLATRLLETAALEESPVAAESIARFLDERLSQLRGTHADRPQELASILEDVGKLQRSLGDSRRARSMFEESLQLRRQALPPEDPYIALSLEYLAYAEMDLGNLDRGVELVQQALEIRRADADLWARAGALNDLALIRRTQGRFREAVGHYREALYWTRQEVGEADDLMTASLMNNLGTSLREMGQYREAEPFLAGAVAMRERLHGSAHLRVAAPLRNLGHLHLERGEREEAGRLFRRSLEIRREAFGDRSHPTVALGQRSLALYHLAGGELETADRLLEEAMQVFRQHYPGNHFQTGRTLRSQASLRRAQGRLDAALSLAQEGLRVSRAAFAGDHWQIADLEALEGGILLDLGHRERALPLLASAHRRLVVFKGEASFAAREAEELLRRAAARAPEAQGLRSR